VLVLLFPCTGGAQGAGVVEGTVLSEDGIGIGGAIVTLEPLRLVEYTDQNGAYAFHGVPAGAYVVLINLGAFEARDEVAVVSGQTVSVKKVLPRDFRLSMTTTVSAASRVLEQQLEAPAAISVVDEKTIALEGGAGVLPSLLQSMPGAEYTQSGVYNIEFNSRGFNGTLSRRVQVLLDGRNLAAPENKNQEWISVGFLAPELETIEFVRGPAAALYGANSINGLVAMTSKSPRGSPGGRARVTIGELGTFIGDLRWAGPLGHDWYTKLVVNHTRSGSFTKLRTTTTEYKDLPLELAPAIGDAKATSGEASSTILYQRPPAGAGEWILGERRRHLSFAGRPHPSGLKRSGRVSFNATQWTAQAYVIRATPTRT
jgi:outer membrane receptor protein involved in Fe transport